MLTDEQKEQLCAKVMAKAAEFAADPAKGRRAGYQPEQKFSAGEPNGSLERPAPIPLRSQPATWLYSVANRDIGARFGWQIFDNQGAPPDLEAL